MIRFSFNDPNKPLREKASIRAVFIPLLEKGSRQMFNIFMQISVFVLAHTDVFWLFFAIKEAAWRFYNKSFHR